MAKRKPTQKLHPAQIGGPESRPEVREKQRVRMAKRRAAVKAKHRNPIEDTIERSNFEDYVSVDSAELFATQVLAEMAEWPASADTQATLPLEAGAAGWVDPPLDAGSEASSTIALALQLSTVGSSDRSCGSSQVAVQDDPILRKKSGEYFVNEALPPAVSPAMRKQKWVGKLGPLTRVQEVQVQVSYLANPVSPSEISDASDATDVTVAETGAGADLPVEEAQRVRSGLGCCSETGGRGGNTARAGQVPVILHGAADRGCHDESRLNQDTTLGSHISM
ncbi:hypothetical protein DFH07DRAFT_775261 [Mycena maculata]|uniref:Uncharacterized protein n=1 Tax=Mycena maculata TaxID=230809 RepID=A0AAD7ITH4_9AGAR|nr:hypothetical protein DFH07DRAFT_775261 [Mycena maculata]